MDRNRSFWLSAPGVAALVLVAIASYFVIVEHRQHLFAFLPYLLLLACPLSHFFMHGNHKHQHKEKE